MKIIILNFTAIVKITIIFSFKLEYVDVYKLSRYTTDFTNCTVFFAAPVVPITPLFTFVTYVKFYR